jgi:hypothetical protein
LTTAVYALDLDPQRTCDDLGIGWRHPRLLVGVSLGGQGLRFEERAHRGNQHLGIRRRQGFGKPRLDLGRLSVSA